MANFSQLRIYYIRIYNLGTTLGNCLHEILKTAKGNPILNKNDKI